MNNKSLLPLTILTLAMLSGCANNPVAQPVNTTDNSTVIPTYDSSAAGGTMPTLEMRISDNAIYVADVKPGNSVKAPLVATKKPAFVVIHKDDNDKAGPVIGVSTLVAAGETQSVTIDLTEATTDGQKLYAMLHVDDGDGVFDAAKDLPATDDQGNELQMIFHADTNAADEPAAVI